MPRRWSPIAAALLVSLLATRASAQVLVGMLLGPALSSDRLRIGFDIGMNLATVDGLEGAGVAPGKLFGLFAVWRFAPPWELQVGVVPLSDRGAKNAAPVPFDDPQLDSLVVDGTMDRRLGYLDLPLVIRYAFGAEGGFRVGAGPQLGVLLSASDRYDAHTLLGAGATVERDVKHDLSTIDAGLALEVAYEIKGLGLAIGVRYLQGLTSLARDDGAPALHNRALSGSGRISLGGRKPKPSDPS
jgi:outer membrane protein with beta-barrel domain